MEYIENASLIFLIIGILMVFIGVFGGGFEIKEVRFPKVGTASRLAGVVAGAVFITLGLISQSGNPDAIAEFVDEKIPVVTETEPPTEKPVIVADNLMDKVKEYGAAWENMEVRNELLFQDYQKIQKNSRFDTLDIETRNTIMTRVEALSQSIAEIDRIKLQDSAQVPITEMLQAWKEVKKVPRFTIEDSKLADEKIAEYSQAIKKYASIHNPDNFLTCKKIKNKNCQHSTDEFSIGKDNSSSILVWAKVHAPRSEKLKLKIFSKKINKMIGEKNLKVSKSSGYRTYRLNKIKQTGEYEARLYNSQSQLIGLRKFTII